MICLIEIRHTVQEIIETKIRIIDEMKNNKINKLKRKE